MAKYGEVEWWQGKFCVHKQKPHFVDINLRQGENFYLNIFILIWFGFRNVALTLILLLENTFQFG